MTAPAIMNTDQNGILKQHRFLLLFALGVTLSYALRLFSEDWYAGTWGAIGACVACLVWHFVLTLRDPRDVHEPDDVYYMGLLYTLSSLVYSLASLFLLSDEKTPQLAWVYNLIGSFGIALISTIFGILFRILLLHYLNYRAVPELAGELEPEDLEGMRRQLHGQLLETASALRAELQQTIADMRTFRRDLGQASEHSVARVDQATEQATTLMLSAGEKQVSLLEQFAQTTHAKVVGIGTQVEGMIENSGAMQAKLLEQVAQTTHEKIAATGKQAVELIARSETKQAQLLEQLFRAAHEKIAAMETQGRALLADSGARQAAQEERQAGLLEKLAQTTHAKITAMEGQTLALVSGASEKQLEEFNKFSQLASKKIAEFAQRMDDINTLVGATRASLQSSDMGTALKDARSSIDTWQSMNAGLQRITADFSQSSEKIKQTADIMEKATETFARSLATSSEASQEYARHLKRHVEDMRSQAQKWQDMTREVHMSLLDAVKKLTLLLREK